MIQKDLYIISGFVAIIIFLIGSSVTNIIAFSDMHEKNLKDISDLNAVNEAQEQKIITLCSMIKNCEYKTGEDKK